MVSKVIFVVLAIVSVAHCSVFMKCDEGKQPLNMEVENCDEDSKLCEVQRSKAFDIKMTFEVEEKAKDLKASIRAQIAGAWIRWPMGSQSKVCNHLTQGKCPLKPGKEAVYNFNIKIPFIAPVGTKTVIELKVVDDDDNVVSCTRFPVLVAA